ncbi:unnamed protein product, partial [Pylaiella littoralis]
RGRRQREHETNFARLSRGVVYDTFGFVRVCVLDGRGLLLRGGGTGRAWLQKSWNDVPRGGLQLAREALLCAGAPASPCSSCTRRCAVGNAGKKCHRRRHAGECQEPP